MFWRRTTGHGAFLGLVIGTLSAAAHHFLVTSKGALIGLKGGVLGVLHTYPSEMAQNFWTAIFAFTGCFVATIVISLATRPNKTDAELTGLVYSLTPKIKEHDEHWWGKPAVLGIIVLGATAILNLLFW
jgi:SSS family solute:Na+ symporter